MSSKAALTIFPANTAVPAGTTKAQPVIGNVLDTHAGYGGMLDWRITNSGALGAPCVIMFQNSPDGTNWFDMEAAYSENLTANTVSQGPSIPLRIGPMYMRAIAYGNTTSGCLVEAYLEHVTSL